MPKTVINDNGGHAVAFSCTTTATSTVQTLSLHDALPISSSGLDFKADTYTLAETGSVTGYTNGTTYSCVKNGGQAVNTNSIALANGDKMRRANVKNHVTQ